MINEWQSLFRSIGFLDTESKVYLACLELGPATAQEISRKAKVSRVTTYNAIEALTERGLMSSIMKEKRKRFMVESPDKLISYAEGRIKHAEDAIQHAKNSMDDLKFLQKGDLPVVKIYEGIDALKNIQEDLINMDGHQSDELGNLDDLLRLYSFKKDLHATHEVLKNRGIKRRYIYLTNDKDYPLYNSDVIKHRMNISPNDYNFSGDVLVYSNKVVLSSLKKKQIAVVIENEEIAKTIKTLFDIIWNLKKKITN